MKIDYFRVILAICLSAGTVIITAAQKAELVVQTGHSDEVFSLSFSPSGKTLASGSLDRTIKIWDVESGKELRTLTGHADYVWSVTFSSDGKTLASGSSDKSIKLWNVESGKELNTFIGHSDSVGELSFSPDGKTLASGSWDKTVKLWDVETGKELRTFNGHSHTVTSVTFSSNGKTLASGSFKTITLWDVETGKKLITLEGHSDFVQTVSFSPDGRTLASGSSDQSVKLWDIGSGKELRALTGHSGSPSSVAFSSDSRTLAIGSQRIVLWDVESGNELRTLTGHSNHVNSIAFSSDGKVLASGGSDNIIKLWDPENGKELRSLKGSSDSVSIVSINSDGKTLTSASGGGNIKLWDLESGTAFKAITGHASINKPISISSDGKTFAGVNGADNIMLWDAESGRELRTFALNNTVFTASFSSDGQTLVSAGVEYPQRDPETVIKLWDIKSGKELKVLTLYSYLLSASTSSDRKTLASSDRFFLTIELTDLESGKQMRTLEGHSSPNRAFPVRALSFSFDGKTLASGGDDRTIKLWAVESGKELTTLAGHSDSVLSVSFSADGMTLASGSLDRKTKIWDVATGKEICSLVALDENDWVVTTPDGRFDTNRIEDSQGIHWVVSDDPLKPIPLEIFMRDYYEPRLLQRLLRCRHLKNCDREFKPLPNLTELNRVQPPVKITNVSMPDSNRKVKVTVEVGKGAVPQRDCLMKRCETGAYDLRLFRDGQIVGSFPGDGQAELIERSYGLQPSIAEKDLWRSVSAIKLRKTNECQTGTVECATRTFEVELPKNKNVQDIEFTAYAFNDDRVKSQTAKWTWPVEMIAKLPKAQAIKPRAYIIAVGVNAFENSDFDLDFAADDAMRMAEVVTQKLNGTGQYENVIPVTLISDYEMKRDRKVVKEKQATKENVHAVLNLLAGRSVDRKLLRGIKNHDQLQKATPDDLVLIMFSSHGYADRAGAFYFIPYDTGPGKGKLFTSQLRQNSISSDELSLWLRDVDAGEMIMIVDACHSSAAIEGSDFKPGPMGSRGLGQLSYDKGMKILTATQSDNVALENNLIKQGLLTYALVRDGIDASQADFKPKDNVINLGEWLAYGVERVPKLYEEVNVGKIQDFGIIKGQRTRAIVFPQNGKSTGKSLEEIVIDAKAQQPSLFDFSRKHREVAFITLK